MSPSTEQSDEPITLWIRQLEAGDPQSARPLWDHFCQKLMSYAGKKLSPKLRRTYDAEDAAVSAFHSLVRIIAVGRATDLNDRLNLWRLLVTITERKIAHRVRDEGRQRRNVQRTVEESCFVALDGSGAGLDNLPGREPTPEFAAEFADLCSSALESLDDPMLREIAQLKLKDYDNEQIAAKLGVTRRTIERKLVIIARRWQERGLPD